MTKDIVTAASVIADRHMVGLKIEDIKEAMVSAMLEYADLIKRKSRYCSGCKESTGETQFYLCNHCGGIVK